MISGMGGGYIDIKKALGLGLKGCTCSIYMYQCKWFRLEVKDLVQVLLYIIRDVISVLKGTDLWWSFRASSLGLLVHDN